MHLNVGYLVFINVVELFSIKTNLMNLILSSLSDVEMQIIFIVLQLIPETLFEARYFAFVACTDKCTYVRTSLARQLMQF